MPIFFLIFLTALPLHAQIKNISIYPSGISVPWAVIPPPSMETAKENKIQEDKKPAKKSRRRSKAKEEIVAIAPPPPPPAPVSETISVNRLVRVVSALTLNPGENLALAFYNDEKEHLRKENLIVSNTAKPSAANIFFMDKGVSGSFKGHLDTYFFPPQAAYMNIAIVDKRGSIIGAPANPDYDKDKLLSIEEFQKLESGRRMMLQFEIRGDAKANILRMAIFRFR